LGTLIAELNRGDSFTVTWNYPAEWLAALAQELAFRCNVDHAAEPTPPGEIAAPPIAVTVVQKTEAMRPADFIERWQQPAWSQIALERTAMGLRFVLPARGLWRGSPAIAVFFALVWSGMIAFVTLLSSLHLVFYSQPPLVFWVLLPPFWILALAMLAFVYVAGSRRTVVLASTTGVIAQDSYRWLRTRQRSWRREDLLDVRVHSWKSNVAAIDRTTELQLLPRNSLPAAVLKYFDFGEYRQLEELEWMATLIRHELQLPLGSV
jgi:hypothetical protein